MLRTGGGQAQAPFVGSHPWSLRAPLLQVGALDLLVGQPGPPARQELIHLPNLALDDTLRVWGHDEAPGWCGPCCDRFSRQCGGRRAPPAREPCVHPPHQESPAPRAQWATEGTWGPAAAVLTGEAGPLLCTARSGSACQVSGHGTGGWMGSGSSSRQLAGVSSSRGEAAPGERPLSGLCSWQGRMATHTHSPGRNGGVPKPP